MKSKLLIVLILFFLIGAGAWKFTQKKGTRENSRGAQTVEAVLGTIEETVEATGEVTALNRVEIKPPIAGRIEEILVNEGARVRAGLVLAWMSSSDRAAILDAARAKGPEELKRWKDSYKPTPIVAPLSGLVILRNIVVGQTVEASTILFAMADSLIVLGQVDEADIGRVAVDMPARITLDAYPEQRIQGKVFQILYEGRNVSNVITYGVKVRPEEVPSFFRSQMTANLNFIFRRKDDALLIPTAAVRQTRAGAKEVMVPDAGGKPTPKTVTVGIEGAEQTEITSGLGAGDKVLIMRARYTPQQAPQSSPLAGGNRPVQGSGSRPQRERQ